MAKPADYYLSLQVGNLLLRCANLEAMVEARNEEITKLKEELETLRPKE